MARAKFGFSAATGESILRKIATCAAGAALGVAALTANHAAAGNVFTGQFGTGGTWNVYEAVSATTSFKEAMMMAAARPDPTGGSAVGHLVTLASLEENNFVHSMAGGGDVWIGLTDRYGAAPGATESQYTFDQTTMGWAWVNGEPFTYQNWNAGEPNNAGAAGEDAVHLAAAANWNDNASGFELDDPEPNAPDFNSLKEGFTQFKYVIEWSTNLATEPTGLPVSRPDPYFAPLFTGPLTRMPGPNGTATEFGVLEVRDLGPATNSRASINMIKSGLGTQYTGTTPRIDMHDPGFGANQGSIPDPQVPFVSDTPATDDDNIQSVIKGTILVPAGKGGAYTFNARSDDGFALRILSQPTGGALTQHKFTAARGGSLDDDGNLVFMAPTGDSNTQGVVNLPPGTYDIEFMPFEDGGGGFWELSTAQGDFVTKPGTPRWLPIGTSATLSTLPQAARLTAPATVKNFGFWPTIGQTISNFRTNPALTAQGTVDDVVLNGVDSFPGPANALDPSFHHPFPNGGTDFFSTAVTGTFEVLDTNGAAGETLTFGLFADDNAALHIVGKSFAGVGGNAAAVLATPTGETGSWLVADYRGGNTDAYASIFLQEGTYDFEAFQLEETGGAGLQVWVAAGDQRTTQFAGGAFVPLTVDTLPANFIPSNQGLALVAGPGTGPVPGAPGDFDGNGVVDGADFLVWQRGYGGEFDAADLATWKANYGTTGVGAVPEPTALGLMTLAAGIAAAWRRRRA